MCTEHAGLCKSTSVSPGISITQLSRSAGSLVRDVSFQRVIWEEAQTARVAPCQDIEPLLAIAEPQSCITPGRPSL